MADEDDFLMGGGGVSAKFETVGTVVRGKIISKPQLRQRTDINTGEPMTWPDGRPQQQLVVQIQTDERDDEIEDDDGVRNLYIRFKMRDAVKEAVKKAGEKSLAVGGELAIKYVSQEKPRKRGQQGTKLYRAKYTPPDPSEFLDDGMGEEDGDEIETPPPAKKATKRAAKKAPAKKAATKAAVDEFSDDDDAGDDGEDDDEGF